MLDTSTGADAALHVEIWVLGNGLKFAGSAAFCNPYTEHETAAADANAVTGCVNVSVSARASDPTKAADGIEDDRLRLKHSTPIILFKPIYMPVMDTVENDNEGLPTTNEIVAVTDAVS